MPNPSQIPRTFAKILPVRSSLKASTVSPWKSILAISVPTIGFQTICLDGE